MRARLRFAREITDARVHPSTRVLLGFRATM
jgi:hypothetical protein